MVAVRLLISILEILLKKKKNYSHFCEGKLFVYDNIFIYLLVNGNFVMYDNFPL